jgi:hypothetical protein
MVCEEKGTITYSFHPAFFLACFFAAGHQSRDKKYQRFKFSLRQFPICHLKIFEQQVSKKAKTYPVI